MALLEDAFKGIGGPVTLGVGALFLLPRLLPLLRPAAKELVKLGISAYDEARTAVSDAYEATGDLVAEARSELTQETTPGEHKTRGDGHHERAAHPSAAHYG